MAIPTKAFKSELPIQTSSDDRIELSIFSESQIEMISNQGFEATRSFYRCTRRPWIFSKNRYPKIYLKRFRATQNQTMVIPSKIRGFCRPKRIYRAYSGDTISIDMKFKSSNFQFKVYKNKDQNELELNRIDCKYHAEKLKCNTNKIVLNRDNRGIVELNIEE